MTDNLRLPERLQYQDTVAFVLLHRLRPDNNVVEVYMANLTNVFSKSIHHPMLVGSRCIATTLRHDRPFIQTPGGPYRSEVNVVRVDTSLEEGVSHVHLAEDLPFPTVSEDIVNAG